MAATTTSEILSYPTFGERKPGRRYVVRPGSYALVREGRKLLIVRERSGWFLPGGGVERGEDEYEALERELLEETGHLVMRAQHVSTVRQLVDSSTRPHAWDKHCHVFDATLGPRIVEPDCTYEWVSFEEATERLEHECFRWLVKKRFLR